MKSAVDAKEELLDALEPFITPMTVKGRKKAEWSFTFTDLKRARQVYKKHREKVW